MKTISREDQEARRIYRDSLQHRVTVMKLVVRLQARRHRMEAFHGDKYAKEALGPRIHRDHRPPHLRGGWR